MVTNFCGQFILVVFGLLMVFECIISLELLELRVPAHVALGTRPSLSCRWALSPADVLYSVKWYKDGKEFFRHVPRNAESCKKFTLPGVNVEESDSSGSSLELSAAVSETAGRYRCEVSGERPLFPTVSKHADLNVVILPDQGPAITGLRTRYQLNDRLQVNCTSGRSRPACQLSLYINGEPAPTLAVLPSIQRRYRDKLETTTLLLDFKLPEEYFSQNQLKIKCLATLAALYWQSNEVSALLEKKIPKRSLEGNPEISEWENSIADRVLTNFASCRKKSSVNIYSICILILIISLIRINN